MFSFLRPQSSGNVVHRIDPAEAARRADAGDLTIIDVREAAEVKAGGKAKGALHIPLALVAMKADPRHPDHLKVLSPEKPVAVYCAAGGRSQMAAQALVALGYAEVYNIGGFGDWCACGGAVEQ